MNIFFEHNVPFNRSNFRELRGIVGLYFIYLDENFIKYPFKESRLLYIGMSKSKANSIEKRLLNHYDGDSSNIGIYNYRSSEVLKYTYLNFDMITKIWPLKISDFESFLIHDFARHFGNHPICNNQMPLINKEHPQIVINWEFFD